MTELPFEFQCGFVGWLGYELKAECGGEAAHESSLPDAAFVFAGRMVAFDHAERRTYLLALAERGDERDAERWLAATARRLEPLRPRIARFRFLPYARETEPRRGSRRSRGWNARAERYLEEIAECRRLLAEGETYEVCLTNAVRRASAMEMTTWNRPIRWSCTGLAPGRTRRRYRPSSASAPPRCSAPRPSASCGSAPTARSRRSRSRGRAAAARRPAEDMRLAERLRSDEKSRAENLMIADLLRNDLGSVCETGTVHVPSLMQVETYETVHQLVTTVRGLLREGLGLLDAVSPASRPAR